tara:strand:- start:266 stop:451 length:186 start_codon:yes stop_codon:yes gene_type:complete
MGIKKFFQRDGNEMVAGKVAGQTLIGKGRVHRHTKGAIPHGLSKIEEEIWKLKQKEKNENK